MRRTGRSQGADGHDERGRRVVGASRGGEGGVRGEGGGESGEGDCEAGGEQRGVGS